jgi:hypothetical protein
MINQCLKKEKRILILRKQNKTNRIYVYFNDNSFENMMLAELVQQTAFYSLTKKYHDKI